MELRKWQVDALEKFVSAGSPRDFCVEATPGAGKTAVSLEWASTLRDDREATQLLVFVPTRNIAAQWVDAGTARGWDLIPNDLRYDGAASAIVSTYQALNNDLWAARLDRFIRQAKTAVVMDEYHHLALDGENGPGNKWGKRVADVVSQAAYRLHLSGTPWREPGAGELMAGYGIDDNGVFAYEPHVRYGYGEAIRDGVCRVIKFSAYDAKAQWVDLRRGLRSAELSADPTGEETRRILDGCLKTHGNTWLPDVIRDAHASLMAKRQVNPDAAGLLVADDKRGARYAAWLIEEVTGTKPVLVLSGGGSSDEDQVGSDDAHRRLADFAHSSDPWLVAVGMVSEGVDIPRLRVGVYATRSRTPLAFRQIVGRFVRRMGPLDTSHAELFMPAIPELLEQGRVIEEGIVHEFQRAEEAEMQMSLEQILNGGGATQAIGSSVDIVDGGLYSTVYRGVEIGDFIDQAQSFCEAEGVSIDKVPAIALLLAEKPGRVASPTRMTSSTPALSMADQIRFWQDKVETAARARDAKSYAGEFGTTNKLLYQKFGKRSTLNVEALRLAYEFTVEDRNWA